MDFDDDLRANPYVGLRPFFKEDTLYFFGREEQTAAVLDILRRERFVGVVGSSGSGKSSLVRAGVLPSLLGGFLVHDRDRWRIATIKPGDNPLGNLAEGLLEAMGVEVTQKAAAVLRQEIADSHAEAVVQYLAARLEANTNLFLLVDQFEEIFAFRASQDDEDLRNLSLEKRQERARRKAEAADFVDLILALSARRDLPIYVVLTMRTDFLGDCDVFYSLPEALNRGRYLVPRMSRDQLREAVECPARLLGVQVGPRLLDHVLNQLGDRFDRLPVLQHALLRTWDEYQKAGGVGPVDLQHYEAAGGLEGALNQDAEAAMSGLSIDTVARVFKRLTDTDASQRRVRCPARISQLQAATGASRAEIQDVLHRFSDNDRNFIRTSADGSPNDLRVDISHESLLRQWDRIREWMDEEQVSRDQYRGLVKDARRWKKNAASLLRDPELQEFVNWRSLSSPSAGWAERYAVADDDYQVALEYLDKSVQQRDADMQAAAELKRSKRARKRWTALAVIVGGVVALFALLALRRNNELEAYSQKLQEQIEKVRSEKARADEQTILALKAKDDALTSEKIADQQREKAEEEKRKADAEQQKAIAQEKIAEQQTALAKLEKEKADNEQQIAKVQRANAEKRAAAAIDVVNKLNEYNSLLGAISRLRSSAQDERDATRKPRIEADLRSAESGAKGKLIEVEQSIANLAAVSSGGAVIKPDRVSLRDLFDLSHGRLRVQLTGESGTRLGPRPAMFGGTSPTPPSLGMTDPGGEGEVSFFDDGRPAGYRHWVSWRLDASVQIRSVALFARSDAGQFASSFRRAIKEFTLTYKLVSGEWNKLPLISYKPSLPYGGGKEGNLLAVCLTVENPTVQAANEYKAEFVQAVDYGTFSAPRIVALDGYADANCGGAK